MYGSEIEIFDTTLRDGSQMEGISFSLEDKIRITEKLDEFGFHYIEGGWPGSNPKDLEYFRRVKNLSLEHAKIAAFGSTRKANTKVERDVSMNAILSADVPVAVIFGKSWDLHVRDALRTTMEENLAMIIDSVEYLKSHGLFVIYDAEHFFDGYRENRDYALATVKAAEEAGAERIVLADTNGGSLPSYVKKTVEEVRKKIKKPLGIHAHNDGELAVANTLMAFEAGATHIQGTVNGYGERCGNANLISIIPALELKYGKRILGNKLSGLMELARFVAELANRDIPNNQPYVGKSAFAHKGGVHVNAVMKNPATYEHINPESVGNRRRVLISELSGKSNLLYKAKELNLHLDENSLKKVLEMIKKMEYDGYYFEGAEASFELLVKRIQGEYRPPFELDVARVVIELLPDRDPMAEATVKIRVHGKEIHTAASGNGPVNALDLALRKALENFYPELEKVHLVDYKVRVLESTRGTASKVRVLIESASNSKRWGTVGASTNIIEASWNALVDSMGYYLQKLRGERDEK